MKHLLRFLALVIAAAAAFGYARPAAASCDVPLAIGSVTGQANVLILQDDSGSMNEAITSTDYNAATTYAGKFRKSNNYNIKVSKYYTPHMIDTSLVAVTPQAYLVTSDGGNSGVYTGNYLNWIYYNATAAQIAAIPVVTRIQSAKSVDASIVASVSGCRFALEVFSNGTAGKMLCNFGATTAALQTAINGITANNSTPLAGALNTAMLYYQTTGVNGAIQASCQKNFVIIVTDGLPNNDVKTLTYCTDVDKDGSLLDDVAGYMYKNDMRADLTGLQNVSTFTIGYNVDANLLAKTATKGGGAYYSVVNSAGLAAALNSAFNLIAARVASGTAVSVVSSDDRTNNKLYRARYQSQTWNGYVESFSLPYVGGNAPLWEAGALLAAQATSTRNIWTSTLGTDKYEFTTNHASTLQSLLTATGVPNAQDIINYTRGDSVSGTRNRNGWRLGDIIDAAPVSVGRPNAFNNFLSYSTFRSIHSSRPELVYVSANDGMMHCFSAATGAEQWAYISKSTLPSLKALMDPAYCHQYFLNVTPVAYDIYMGGAWKTVVIGGQGQAGNGYFALDVTSPTSDSMAVLWDLQVPNLNSAWNGPTLIRDHNRDAYVLAVGTGYNASIAQANLVVLDPSNGSTLSTFALGTAIAGNKVTKATAVDKDFDGYEDVMYLGDLMGNIWRINLTTNPWSVTKLFACSKPIQAAPVVTLDALGRAMVCFGTGEYISPTDPGTVTTQTIYAVIDDNSGGTVLLTDLVDQTSVFHAVTSATKGWSMDLTQAAGERVTHSPVMIAGTLYVTSFQPNTSACAGGGQSWLYSLDYKDGSAPDNANGTANNVLTDRVQSEGDGILADPSVDLMSESIILQSSNTVLLTENIGGSLKRLMVRSWRQKWN